MSHSKLLVIFSILLVATVTIQLHFYSKNTYSEKGEKAAAKLTEEWFNIIEKAKMEKGISFSEGKQIEHGALLGKEYSYITTTLGSLEAKETSLNPKFASIIYRWLVENKIDSTKTVGVIISGSFPSLAICSLAAIQIIGAGVVLISSLGSSTYGANEPEATWIDYETWLRERGCGNFSSSIITLGGENDVGEGMPDEGIEELKSSVKRNSQELYVPSSLEESISFKMNYLLNKNISLLINVGGNQAAIGACAHSPVLPTGEWNNYSVCDHKLKGIISRIYERGIPVIHLLNIRDLAAHNGLVIGKVKQTSKRF